MTTETATPTPAATRPRRRRRAAGDAPAKKTQYHVLRLVPGLKPGEELVEGATAADIQPDRWEIVATLTATGSETAKRTYFKGAAEQAQLAGTVGDFAETLVAVPTGSWNPQPYGVELQMRIVIG